MEWTIHASALPAEAGPRLPTLMEGRLSWPRHESGERRSAQNCYVKVIARLTAHFTGQEGVRSLQLVLGAVYIFNLLISVKRS